MLRQVVFEEDGEGEEPDDPTELPKEGTGADTPAGDNEEEVEADDVDSGAE